MKARTISESAGKDDGTGHRATLKEKAAAIIREKSAALQLISSSEISALLADESLSPSDGDQKSAAIAAILRQLVHETDDLQMLSGTGSRCYYSAHYMTDTYAIILLRKRDGPLRLIAETVRQYACTYQRPVSLDIFTGPPFNLTRHQVLDCLTAMAAAEGCDDILTTSTSANGIYLYSTSHMEAEHAAMLAEWLDVGQSDNP
jgi:hypothetical protein